MLTIRQRNELHRAQTPRDHLEWLLEAEQRESDSRAGLIVVAIVLIALAAVALTAVLI